MTVDEILTNAHSVRRQLYDKIAPYISKEINYDKINKIYCEEIIKFAGNDSAYIIETPKYKKLKRTKSNHLKDIFIYFYLLFANITNAYISYLDENTNIFFSGFDLYEENNINIIEKALDDFKNRSLFDNEMLEFLQAENPNDTSLIIKNKMIDIYLIQKLSHYQKYYELVNILTDIKTLSAYEIDYSYKFIIKIVTLIK